MTELNAISKKVLPISAVILTHNSDRTLASVLESLCFCDEIVIVDSGSTDQTLQIAEQYTCKVFHRKLQGFGPQKNFGVAQTTHPWVFAIDSDEIVSDRLRAEIFHVFQNTTQSTVAFSMLIQLYFLGKPILYSGQQTKLAIRLFDKRYAKFNQALVHEAVHVEGEIRTLKHPIFHHSYLSLEDYFYKLNRYTSLGARSLTQEQSSSKRYKVVTSFPTQFFKFYFLKLGFLDGYHGFLWCFLSAVYPVVKYAKYEEIRNPHQSAITPQDGKPSAKSREDPI